MLRGLLLTLPFLSACATFSVATIERPQGPADESQVVRRWDIRTSAAAVFFTPDDRAIVTFAPNNGLIGLWDAAGGQMLREVPGARAIAISSDGARIATGKAEHDIIVYELATGQIIREIPTAKPVLSLAFSPDGATVAAILDEKHSEVSKEFLIIFAISGTRISGDLHLYPVSAGAELAPIDLQQWGLEVYWPGHDLFAFDGTTLRAFDPATRAVRRSFEPERPVVVLSAAGNTLVMDATAIDVEHDKRIQRFEPANEADQLIFALSPDGKRAAIAVADDPSSIAFWSLETGKATRAAVNVSAWVNAMAFSHDNALLAVTCVGQELRLLRTGDTTNSVAR